MKARWLKSNDKIYDDENFDIMDEDNFVLSSRSHPSGRSVCSASAGDKADIKDLKKCRRFEHEDEYTPKDNCTCAHYHGLGFKGVCEKHLIVGI